MPAKKVIVEEEAELEDLGEEEGESDGDSSGDSGDEW